eukprot:4297189-Pleurochrysis_carterae.AAC.1
MSGRVWVEQYSKAPTRDWYVARSLGSGEVPCSFAWSASSTRSGRSSAAGASTQSASVAISTLRRSDTGPSSSTFHRDAKAVVNAAYNDDGPSFE